MGIAYDAYHLWWDPDLEEQTKRTAEADRLFAYHRLRLDDPTTDLLNDRGLMGEGCIDLRGIRGMVEGAGFDGMIEVEVFSNRWWSSHGRIFASHQTSLFESYLINYERT